MSKTLSRFLAVTTTGTSFSMYLARSAKERSALFKLDLKGESRIPANPSRNISGDKPLLAICRFLVPYEPITNEMAASRGSRAVELVDTYFWGAKSPSIVALFEKVAEARECFSAPDLMPCDPRWHAETRLVLEKIGSEHPAFYISDHPELRLPLPAAGPK